MICANVLNPNKTNKIEGNCFHLFYPDLNTSYLFDRNLTEPIIFGSKNIVMTWVKKLDELMNVKPDHKIRIYSYILGADGFRKIQTFNAPIEHIGKYIKRY